MIVFVTEAAYSVLHAATDGVVREIVELHKPVPYKVRKAEDVAPDRYADGKVVVWWNCEGCEFGGYDGEPAQWPCSTTSLIAERVGLQLRDVAYYFDHATDKVTVNRCRLLGAPA